MLTHRLMGVKPFLGESIGTRPLLFGGFFMVIAGIQMVTSGVVGRTSPACSFRVRRIALSGTWSRTADDAQAWMSGPANDPARRATAP